MPNFASLKVKLFGIRIALGMILKDIIKWADKNLDTNTQIKIMYIEDAILGTENKKGIREGGLQGIIQALVGIFALTKRIKINVGTLITVMLSLKMLGMIINIIIGMQEKFSALADKTIYDRVNAASKTLEKVADIFKTVCLLGILSIPLLFTAIILIPALIMLSAIILEIKGVMWLLEKLKLDDKTLNPLTDIVTSLKEIMLNILLLGLIAIPAIIAMTAIISFSVGLILFVITLAKFTNNKTFTKTINITSQNILEIIKIILALVVVAGSILAFTLIAKVLSKVIKEVFVPTIILLFATIIFIGVTMGLASLISKLAKKASIQVATNVIMISGCFIVAALAILVAAVVGEKFKSG
jgi:hypothetical protein